MGRPTPVLKEMVLDLYAGGLGRRGIRAATGIRAYRTIKRILDHARAAGDSRAAPRPARAKCASKGAFFVSFDPVTRAALAEAAERRGLDAAELVCQLTEVIVRDGLIDGVMDDAAEQWVSF